MPDFIKSCSLPAIKKKLLILYILNVSDIGFTYLLLSTGLYNEVNRFMAGVVGNTGAILIYKIVLPALLLLYINKRLQRAAARQLRYSSHIINGAVALYILINGSHLLWISLIPVFMRLI